MGKKYVRKNRKGKRKGKRKNQASVMWTNGREIVAKRLFTQLSFDSGSIGASSTTTPQLQQFYMNSIFRPHFTGSPTTQARGTDQLITLYNNYLVHACRVTVTAQNLSAGTAAIVCLYGHAGNAYPANVRAMQELPDAHTCVFTTEKPCVKTVYYDMPKLFGVSKQKYRIDDLYSEGLGGSPADIAWLSVQWQNLDEVTTTGFALRVKMTFYVELFGPKKLGAS